MTSSMLSGERRWATSTRRGGKTVLGKVAVPKPINLPSQRLENHGLDPSVEIVPKGTHSWGSRPSSSTSNAWGTVSPGTEGGTGSPSHLSGRPSSGGSNTRPSTSSSDRAHEPNANAWGPNSRPSSASGALTSNQTLLTSLRPRSAETRPGSSQLSRFAEPLPENTGAWGAAGTPEILGAMASKNDGFSLSSGDFPTLGSEKDNSGRNIDSQDHSSHGRPVSSSGGVALPKEGNGASIVGDVSVDANVKSGNANSWRRDKCEDAVPSGVEKWQTDPQPYPNPSIPHHFEAWHGPPVTNPPGGVWFRGPPGGHPYGPPVGPGAFPMEPFPYYRPQMPATTLANPQPGPPPGGGPRGHHPNNGDLYRPHMTDAYIRPGMPIRPGFYPGPVAYEGYYGGPMGYCNSNDRDVPFMGMASGPPVYNRYSTQNAPEPSSSQGRSGGYGSAGKTMVPEHMESGRPHDTQGPYKVLLKQQNGWDGRNKERKWEGTISTDAAYIEKADQPGMSSWENDWRSDYRNDVEISLRQMTPSQEISSQTCDDRRSSVPVKVNSPKSVGNMKVSDDIPASNLECASSGSPEIPGSVSAVPKDSTLIKKIEGLNAKARAADGQHNIASVSSWEGQKKKFSVHNAKASHPADEGGRGFVYAERIHATGITNPASRETGVSVGDKSLESMAAGGTTISRSIHDMQGRGGNHGKGGHNGLEVDGWRKKAQVMETSVVSASRSDTNSTVFVHDHHTSFEASKKSLQFPRAREERESAPPVFDPSDNQAQHTKLRELEQRAKQLREEEEEERTRKQMAKVPVFDPSDNQAQHTKLRELEQRAKQLREEEEERTRKQMAKAPVFDPSDNQAQHTKLRELEQRAKQLREEEEERTRKQMAKARAKLEDLDRRKQSMKGPTQKSEASSDAMQSSEGSTSRVVQSPDLSSELPPEKPKSVNKEFVVQNQSVSFQHGADSADVTRHNNAPHIQDGDAPRQKRNGYREKQSLEKNSNVKSISTSNNEAPKNHTDASGKITVSVGEVAIEIAPSCQSNLPLNSNAVPGSSSFPMNANAMTESSVSQRKKNNKGGKNKHKVEVASSVATSQSLEAKEPNLVNASLELGKPIVFQTELDSNSVQSVTISKDENQLFEHQSSLPSEDSHGRANSQWKAQHSRRMSKNSQLNRSAEKFHGDAVWAPVGSQNKADADEASHKNVVEAITPFMKIDHQAQGNPKNKRAEIERYIPKPVAKEMAQQGSIQQLVASSGNQTTSDEVIEGADSSPGTKNSQPAGSAVGKVGLAFESRNRDGRQNKQGRAHGSWRQRGSTELVGVQSLQDGPSYPGQNVQNPVKDYQTQKLDVGLVKEQQTYSDEWNAPDGGNIPDNSDSVAHVAVTAITDQGVTGRAKRLPLKGHKGMGNNNGLDQKECSSGDADKIDTQSSSLEMSHIHLPTTSKDNRGTGERSTAHWQPKSQTFPANSQGSRTNSVRSGGPGVVWTNKKESTPQGATVPLTPLHDKRTGEGVSPPCHDQFPSKKVDAEEALGAGGHREAKRGKKVGSLKGRPHSPNLVPVSPVEQAPGSMDVRQEQRSSSGFRKSGNQNNNRFSRLHESRGDWNSSGHDSKHNNPSSNWDRQRPNSHYEYQPVGPDNNNKSNIAEGPKDGIPNTGPRFRERGQNHSRHGGGRFYGRQGGTDRVDADYE